MTQGHFRTTQGHLRTTQTFTVKPFQVPGPRSVVVIAGTAAIHRRHPGGPSLPDGGAAMTRGSHDGSRLEPPYSGLPLLEARRHMSHHPVAANRTDGHGTLLVACPCEPGRTSRTGDRSCAIMAFMTVLTARRCPGAHHHSSGTTLAGPPMPPFPWHFNPCNPWPLHHSYVQQPRSQSQ